VNTPAGPGDGSATSSRGPAVWVSLRRTLAARKWIVWALAVLLLFGALQLATMLIPHSGLRSLESVEEKSNGIQELPTGVPTKPSQPRKR
jgi:hypothetical protein